MRGTTTRANVVLHARAERSRSAILSTFTDISILDQLVSSRLIHGRFLPPHHGKRSRLRAQQARCSGCTHSNYHSFPPTPAPCSPIDQQRSVLGSVQPSHDEALPFSRVLECLFDRHAVSNSDLQSTAITSPWRRQRDAVDSKVDFPALLSCLHTVLDELHLEACIVRDGPRIGGASRLGAAEESLLKLVALVDGSWRSEISQLT